MTRTANARLAGFTFLAYIATGITSMVLFGQAAVGASDAARLTSIAQHGTTVRLTAVLTLYVLRGSHFGCDALRAHTR